jgi:hypothetical protein
VVRTQRILRDAPRSGFPSRDHPRRLPDRPAPGHRKAGCGHSKPHATESLSTGAPTPTGASSLCSPTCAGRAEPSPHRQASAPSRFGRRRDPSRPRTRLQPRRSARHTGESTSGGIDDLTSGRTGAQNWMICIRGQAQTARLETAYIRRSVIVRADYDMPLVTVRDRDERCRSVNRKSSSCSLGSPPGIAVSAGLRLGSC